MKQSSVCRFINELADEIREKGCIGIEGAVYCYDDFPPGFWRKLVKDVNFVEWTEQKLNETDSPKKTPFPPKERIRDHNGI